MTIQPNIELFGRYTDVTRELLVYLSKFSGEGYFPEPALEREMQKLRAISNAAVSLIFSMRPDQTAVATPAPPPPPPRR
jgi:hypothetical protein